MVLPGWEVLVSISTSSMGSIYIHIRWKKSQRRKTGQRDKLPNKVLDFQVRVHVLEGRHLAGSGINPVVKVLCGKKIKKTSIQKGTNTSLWDEVGALQRCGTPSIDVHISVTFISGHWYNRAEYELL